MKNKRIEDEQYIPEDPLEFLKRYESSESFTEVLYTFGDQEIVKDNVKFYLSNTINQYYNKEITREMATEIWQSCNMKPRSDVSMNFDLK
ncbi:MAG: hypothetical protein IJ272_08795 [Clostridia bacterium]|nr:hypothetical protein [Clostridia bacterium]